MAIDHAIDLPLTPNNVFESIYSGLQSRNNRQIVFFFATVLEDVANYADDDRGMILQREHIKVRCVTVMPDQVLAQR